MGGGEGEGPHFDDSLGKFKIDGSMESLVEMAQIENSLRNYVTLINPLKRVFLGF